MSSVSEHVASKVAVEVLDGSMAYVDRGRGAPIVFLHGNPTSSVLWREVMPRVAHLGRCIAPDLIGMGDSAKRAPGAASYRFAEHRAFVEAFLEAVVGIEPVILVVHDWGSALGFDWASRHPDRVRGIAYAEAVVAPFVWSDFDEAGAQAFGAMRSEAGEEMVLGQNSFVEQILPGGVLRELTSEEHDEYRRPYATADDRWPTLQWPREVPIEGQPDEVRRVVEDYGRWLERSPVPKLFINADPGVILTGRLREYCRSWPNQTEVTVAGAHYVQEDSGAEMGDAIAAWIGAM